MNDRTDRTTPIERHGAQDCLVEMALAWLQQPLGELSEAARRVAIDDVILLISQMRHLDARAMERERDRWSERVAVRLCQQCGAMRQVEGLVHGELARLVLKATLQYHDWRERVAPIVPPSIAAGPSDGGEIHS